MSIVVTVGANDANSFGTLAEFKAFSVLFGYDLSSSDDAALEIALVQGAAYLERGYEGKWRGYRSNKGQGMAWPRRSRPANVEFRSVQGYNGILDEDGFEIAIDEIPVKVKQAQFEAAFAHISGANLLPTLERGGAIASESAGAGPAQASTTYAPGASPRDRITKIEGLLSAYVMGHPGGSIATVGVVRG